jgi:hypothetical protein
LKFGAFSPPAQLMAGRHSSLVLVLFACAADALHKPTAEPGTVEQALAAVIEECTDGQILLAGASALGATPSGAANGGHEPVLDAESLATFTRFILESFDCAHSVSSDRSISHARARRKTLIVHAHGALAPRLLAYASARALARATGRLLLLVWEPDEHCAARFDHLFEPLEGELVLHKWSAALLPRSLFNTYRQLDCDPTASCAHARQHGYLYEFAAAERHEPGAILPEAMAERAAAAEELTAEPRARQEEALAQRLASSTRRGRIEDQAHDHIYVLAKTALVSRTANFMLSRSRPLLSAALLALEPSSAVRIALAEMLGLGAGGRRLNLIGWRLDASGELAPQMPDGGTVQSDLRNSSASVNPHPAGTPPTSRARPAFKPCGNSTDLTAAALAMHTACATLVAMRRQGAGGEAVSAATRGCTLLLHTDDDDEDSAVHALVAVTLAAGLRARNASASSLVVLGSARQGGASSCRALGGRSDGGDRARSISPEAAQCEHERAARLLALSRGANVLLLPAQHSPLKEMALLLSQRTRLRRRRLPVDICGWLALAEGANEGEGEGEEAEMITEAAITASSAAAVAAREQHPQQQQQQQQQSHQQQQKQQSMPTAAAAPRATEPRQRLQPPNASLAAGLPATPPTPVSAVAACRGRHQQLAGNLPSWLRVEGVGEVILVDWSSSPPLRPTIERVLGALQPPSAQQPLLPPLLLARVEGERSWVLSRAFNVGFRLSTGALVLKLDCDVRLDPSFVAAHAQLLLAHWPGKPKGPREASWMHAAAADSRWRRRAFVAGNWRYARSDNELHLNGLLLAWRTALRQVGGYDERIASYGWDDSDLYARLGASGERREMVNGSFVQHVEHDSAERLSVSAVRASERALPDEGGAAKGPHLEEASEQGLGLWQIVKGTSAAELELSAAELAAVAIQQNRLALEQLPNPWGGDCDADGSSATTVPAGRLDPAPASAGEQHGDVQLPPWTHSPAAWAACRGDRERFDAWCGSEYAWLQTACASNGAARCQQGACVHPGTMVPGLVELQLRASRATPELRDIVGKAVFQAAWYEALAQELPGFRRARAAAN